MRVMIVDDEQPSLDELAFLLKRHGDVEIAGAYLNPLDALDAASGSLPDALFTDIVMPHMSGMELAVKIRALNSKIQIVFVTAYPKQFMVMKNVIAAGCILKPVSGIRLGEALTLLREKLEGQKANEN